MARKIALDFDSTLAATAAVGFDLMLGPDHDYTYSDIESWDWGTSRFGTARYLSSLWHAWTLRPLDVPKMEKNIEDAVKRLQPYYDVDIVTAHPDHMGISDGKKHWLNHHDIHYNDFVVVDVPDDKTELDYDIYIDDKPTMVEKVTDAWLFLVDHEYNRDVPHNDRSQRVSGVTEAVERILDPSLSPDL